MYKDVIENIRQAKLCGRGGAGFPTATKWEMFAKSRADKKYIICNASEGDPQMSKDGYLLKNQLKDVLDGVKIALETFPGSIAYIYLRKDYYKRFGYKLKKLARNLAINIVKKQGGYLSGH